MADKQPTVKIEWVFHRDIRKQGTTEEVPVDEARPMVRTGRARYANVTAEKTATKPVAPTS